MQSSWSPEDLKLHLERAKTMGWLEFFVAASKKTGVSRSVLIAIASRESGMQNIVGNEGHGYGIMQINDHDHWKWLQSHDNGMDPKSNIDFAATIIHSHLVHFQRDYLKAVSAYKSGVRNVDLLVAKGMDPDFYTPGRNFGKNVMARAEEIRKMLKVENIS